MSDLKTANAARAAIESCDYRVSESHWAGGNHTTIVSIGSPSANGFTERVWSKNGKWSGSNSLWSITVPSYWRTRVQRFGLDVVNGLFTLDAKRIPKSQLPAGIAAAWSAVWVVQGQGMILRAKAGVIVESWETYFLEGPVPVRAHGKTLTAAKSVLKRRVAAQRVDHGYLELARDVRDGVPQAIATYRRLTNRQLALLDETVHTGREPRR